MDLPSARNLTNNFQDVRLCSLRHWSNATTLAPEGTNGPYIILQSGLDPQDPAAGIGDFILGRNGRWLPLAFFYGLPVDMRRDQYVFRTAADAIGILERLLGKPEIERGQGRQAGGAATPEDELNQAIAKAHRDDPGRLPSMS